jgi:signal recognition particle subunit SRP54
VLSLIERAESAIDSADAARMEETMRSQDFTLDDFQAQLRTLKKMGPLEQVLGMIPGLGNLKQLGAAQPDEKEMNRVEAILGSMTKGERRNYKVIDGSRRRRIARGSGTSVEEINRLLRQFMQMRKMLKAVGGMGGGNRKKMRQAMTMIKGRGLRA